MKRRTFLAGAAAAWGSALYGQAPAAPRRGKPAATLSTRENADVVIASAISFAAAQAGKKYLWGGTGPDAYDCSGLTQTAYRHAGLAIPRRSQEQWTRLAHVSQPQRGDLVFFPGSDGTWSEPGHVALVLDPDQHLMIEAYAPGVPIGIRPYGVPGALEGDRSRDVIGFSRPAAT